MNLVKERSVLYSFPHEVGADWISIATWICLAPVLMGLAIVAERPDAQID